MLGDFARSNAKTTALTGAAPFANVTKTTTKI